MKCLVCKDDVPYRIYHGKCVRCLDAEYLASDVSAPQWVADHLERADEEDFVMARRWNPET